jgi:two-component system sensor histidine kinase FlrB
MAQAMAHDSSGKNSNNGELPGVELLDVELLSNVHADNLLNQNPSADLAYEAFPGELAALRRQAKQHKPANIENNTPLNTTPFSLASRSVFDSEQNSLNLYSNSNSNHHVNQNSKLIPKLHSNNHAELFSDQLLANQLIDVMPTGLVMLDGNGIVVKINQVARNLLDEPILGQPWFNVIARSFNPKEDDWHEVSLKDGRRVKLEITTLGAQPGQLIMITDLTETRLLQDKLAQMQRLSSLGKMVSTLAHQIRTPLSAAILYSENLTNSTLADSARTKFQAKLNDRLYDLEQQVNDMLLFSKSGKEQVVAPISIVELIDDSVNAMEALLDNSNTQLNITLPEPKLQILGNKNALTGAIQNLLHNALQAMSAAIVKKPLITIQLYSKDNHVYVSVKDNGPGIDAKIIDKIFKPFYTSSSKGTGLGLAVVKSVVGAHQGEVKLINQADCGAHFVIKLPLLNHGVTSQTNKVGEN